MTFEQDPCLVRALTGELLVQGFVRQHDGVSLEIDAQHFTGRWLDPGDEVQVEIRSAVKGACTYDARVTTCAVHRVWLDVLGLREAVQQRSAVRVLVTIPLRVSGLVLHGNDILPDEPLDVVMVDISAFGMRLRTSEELAIGTEITVPFDLGGQELQLTGEILRAEQIRIGYLYGCRLVGAREATHELLFRFVLAEQRRQRAQQADLRPLR